MCYNVVNGYMVYLLFLKEAPMSEDIQHSCCFFGNRNTPVTPDLKSIILQTVEMLIAVEKVDTFLFGSKSSFNSLCLEAVTELKQKFPHVKLVYVRAEYPYIDEAYKAYLLNFCDETYFPERLSDAGKAVYVERNREMIDKSRFCIVYYDEGYTPSSRCKASDMLIVPEARKSGTKLALDYAIKKKKEIFIFTAAG